VAVMRVKRSADSRRFAPACRCERPGASLLFLSLGDASFHLGGALLKG
jgi:hypothetical protein